MSNQELERIYRKYFPCVYSVCILYMKNEADACDMVQETFIKLYRSQENFPKDENVKAWLLTVASNACKSELRKWWREHTTEFIPDYHAPSYEEKENILIDLMNELKEKYRLPLYLYYFEGYKSHEIAKILGISASAVRSRIEKGRKLLKKELTTKQEDEQSPRQTVIP